MPQVIEVLASAPGERIALVVSWLVILLLAYFLRELWKRDRRQEKEFQEINKLQRELLGYFVKGGRNDSGDQKVAAEPKAPAGAARPGKKRHPRPGASGSGPGSG
jgi:hypothetical protein